MRDMPKNGKTLWRAAQQTAVYLPDGTPTSPHARVCFRCGRRINGYAFYTLYGYVERQSNGKNVRAYACGEAVHDRCAGTDVPRVVEHDPDIEGMSEYARHMRNVSPGIDYNARTGRYAARVGKKRLGTHPTQDAAQDAINTYLEGRND